MKSKAPTLKQSIKPFERKIITDAIAAANGSRTLAARMLGITTQTLRQKLR